MSRRKKSKNFALGLNWPSDSRNLNHTPQAGQQAALRACGAAEWQGIGCRQLAHRFSSKMTPAKKKDGEWVVLIRKFDCICFSVNKYKRRQILCRRSYYSFFDKTRIKLITKAIIKVEIPTISETKATTYFPCETSVHCPWDTK